MISLSLLRRFVTLLWCFRSRRVPIPLAVSIVLRTGGCNVPKGNHGPQGLFLPPPGLLPTLPIAQDAISALPGALSPCPTDAIGCWSPARHSTVLLSHGSRGLMCQPGLAPSPSWSLGRCLMPPGLPGSLSGGWDGSGCEALPCHPGGSP